MTPDSAGETSGSHEAHSPTPVLTYGLSAIDAERLIRFAAEAANLGILDAKAAWECGFDGDDENNVVAVALRAYAYRKEHGL